MTEYDSQHYQEMRAAAIRHFPLATVLEPKRLFRSRQHWLTTWPELLPTLTRVVFFTAPDGWLGRGVVTELQDVRARQLPIHLLSEHGELIPWTRLTFTIPNRGNWTRHLQVSVRPCPE
jgi:hypothetical protein